MPSIDSAAEKPQLIAVPVRPREALANGIDSSLYMVAVDSSSEPAAADRLESMLAKHYEHVALTLVAVIDAPFDTIENEALALRATASRRTPKVSIHILPTWTRRDMLLGVRCEALVVVALPVRDIDGVSELISQALHTTTVLASFTNWGLLINLSERYGIVTSVLPDHSSLAVYGQRSDLEQFIAGRGSHYS